MPPVRGRELKPERGHHLPAKLGDAPCAGARIETFVAGMGIVCCMMPPVRGRELKLECVEKIRRDAVMPPVRGRELKQHMTIQKIYRNMMPPVRGRELKLQEKM